MTLIPIIFSLVAGISLYIGLLHLLIACGRLKPWLHFFFGLSSLISFGYVLALIAQYQAINVDDYINVRKLITSLGYIFGITTVRFVSIYTNVKPICLILVLNSLYIISLLINQISPTGILYSYISSISSVSLPWGESISYAEGTLTPLFSFQLLALICNTIYGFSACYIQYRRVYGFSACYIQYRRGEKKAGFTLGLSLAILIATVQHDRLVDLGKIQFIYLAEFGFLSFIVIMSLSLSKDLIQAVKLREQLLESERLRKIAVELERNRLARDLHDSVSQTLFTVATTAEALPRVWKRNPDIAEQGLEELAQLTQGALAEMRNLLIELRPSGLAEKPLTELLQQVTLAISGRASLQVTTTIVQGDYPLSNEVKLVFYRITQVLYLMK